LALHNKRCVFNLMFAATAATLQAIARNPKHLGADVGFTAILHTWGQNLQFHPHLHCVVTGGGLAPGDHHWIRARDGFFLPVTVLGRLFRGKFLHGLREARRKGKLRGRVEGLQTPAAWTQLLDQLYQLDWVVYAKPPFGGPDHVFRYLGRYTHRVAISNHRLVEFDGDCVTFKVRDHADGASNKRRTLSAGEFIRRFLLHVLPRRFVRIRHFGLMAARNVHTRLARARTLLTPEPTTRSSERTAHSDCPEPWWKRLLRLTGVDVMLCPFCGDGRMIRTPIALLARSPP
jgi:hypothetical protein